MPCSTKKEQAFKFSDSFHIQWYSILSYSTGNFMAQSSSEESELYSLFTDLFDEKPPPAPQPQSKPEAKSLFSIFGKPQPPINTPTERERQDALVKKFPGTKIVRRAKEEVVAPNDYVHHFPQRHCEKR